MGAVLVWFEVFFKVRLPPVPGVGSKIGKILWESSIPTDVIKNLSRDCSAYATSERERDVYVHYYCFITCDT